MTVKNKRQRRVCRRRSRVCRRRSRASRAPTSPLSLSSQSGKCPRIFGVGGKGGDALRQHITTTAVRRTRTSSLIFFCVGGRNSQKQPAQRLSIRVCVCVCVCVYCLHVGFFLRAGALECA